MGCVGLPPMQYLETFLRQSQGCSFDPFIIDESKGTHLPKSAREESLGTGRQQGQDNFNKSVWIEVWAEGMFFSPLEKANSV